MPQFLKCYRTQSLLTPRPRWANLKVTPPPVLTELSCNSQCSAFLVYGCPALLVQFWMGVLSHHCHQVKTRHGISAGSYSCSADSPIHGPGQGSRGGPASCVVSTSILLQGLDKLARGIQFCDPSQSRSYINKAPMFIDDNTSATNRFRRWLHNRPTLADIVTHLQADAQVSERLLFTSGGLLKLRKCLYYVMSWDFDSEGRATLCSKEDIPSLRLTNGTDLSPKDI
jgi:hypothetical protein